MKGEEPQTTLKVLVLKCVYSTSLDIKETGIVCRQTKYPREILWRHMLLVSLHTDSQIVTGNIK